MKTLYAAISVCLLSSSSLLSATDSPPINYFDSPPPPSNHPVVFAKGIVSKEGIPAEKICFSSDGKDMFFGTHPDPNAYFKPVLMHSKYIKGKWSEPVVAPFVDKRLFGWPLISPNGNTLYLEKVVGEIFYSNKEAGEWTEPKQIKPDVTAKEGFGLAQLTNDNTFYFHDRMDRIAYSSILKDGEYSTPKPLHYRINPCVEFFVSPNNDYIIFLPINWSNQFHISFRESDEKWSLAQPFSKYFKAKDGWDSKGYGPSVSPDGKYFFFTQGPNIHWVKTDFIEALRTMSQNGE